MDFGLFRVRGLDLRAITSKTSPLGGQNFQKRYPLDFKSKEALARADDGDGGGDDGDDVHEAKFPRGSRPSPAPVPRNKIIPFGGHSLRP